MDGCWYCWCSSRSTPWHELLSDPRPSIDCPLRPRTGYMHAVHACYEIGVQKRVKIYPIYPVGECLFRLCHERILAWAVRSGGGATCSKGFVICFLKIPIACVGSCCTAQWPGELSENILQNLRNKLRPHTVCWLRGRSRRNLSQEHFLQCYKILT